MTVTIGAESAASGIEFKKRQPASVSPRELGGVGVANTLRPPTDKDIERQLLAESTSEAELVDNIFNRLAATLGVKEYQVTAIDFDSAQASEFDGSVHYTPVLSIDRWDNGKAHHAFTLHGVTLEDPSYEFVEPVDCVVDKNSEDGVSCIIREDTDYEPVGPQLNGKHSNRSADLKNQILTALVGKAAEILAHPNDYRQKPTPPSRKAYIAYTTTHSHQH